MLVEKGKHMPKRRLEEVIVAEHILEVRTEASGSFLDVRGYVADYVRNEGLFPHWRIEENMIRFFDQEQRIEKLGAFIGYRSIGFLAYNPDTRNYFPEKAASFWRHVVKNTHYQIPPLRRFGSRTKAFLSSEEAFAEICSRIYKTFCAPGAAQLIGTTPSDLQIVLDSPDGEFKTRLIVGPTQENEAKRYFSFPSDHFARPGVYVDVDCFKTEDLSSDQQVPGLLKRSMEIIWGRIERLANAIEI
jgi:hypothetical protein